jgi:mRNA degradation ribonuclease J1/J2
VQKQEDLQTALEFAKSELGRFEAALKERQQLSHQRMTSAQLKIDEQQRKINSFAAKMSSGTLTPQESLELEQARRDKADAEKQLAAEKDVKGINEKPIEALMQAKREEISRIEADLQALAGMDTATP